MFAPLSSLVEQDAAAAHLLREIPLLRETVDEAQHVLAVVHVQLRAEREVGDDGGIDVDQPPGCVLGEEVPAALVQKRRWLSAVFWKPPSRSRPLVTSTASGFQSVNALTGPADQSRQDEQWQ